MADPTPDFLTVHAEAHPDRLGVVEGDRAIDYRELNRQANRIAHALIAVGVRAGTKVVWCGQNSLEVVIVVNGARKAGAVSVPLNYRLAPDEAAYVIDNSDATVVIFDIEQLDQLDAARGRCPQVEHWLAFRTDAAAVPGWAHHLEAAMDRAPEGEATPVGAGETAGQTMIYTSGTTGRPKGTVRTRSASTSGALVELIGYAPDDVYLTTGPLYHSGPLGFMGIVQSLGGSVVVQRRFDAEEWLGLIERHRVTTTFSAPTPVRRVVDLPAEIRQRYDYSTMKRLVANAAPWPFDLKRRYVEAFGDDSLWEVYGSTELGVNTVLRPQDQMAKPGSCGRPAPGVEIALFDDDGELVTEPHVPGELFVRAAGTFDGYYKASEKFEEARRDDWLTVGDVAYVDEDGFYFICDRKKDMIISGGMNIYPAEIEATLVTHSDIADAAVVGVPSEEWGEAVHAVLTTYSGEEVDRHELDAFCREHLASYKVPRSVTYVEEIPRTPSGKILKRELRAPFWEGHERQVG